MPLAPFWFLLCISLLVFAGYALCQLVTVLAFEGRWRSAALLPLVVAGLAMVLLPQYGWGLFRSAVVAAAGRLLGLGTIWVVRAKA